MIESEPRGLSGVDDAADFDHFCLLAVVLGEGSTTNAEP